MPDASRPGTFRIPVGGLGALRVRAAGLRRRRRERRARLVSGRQRGVVEGIEGVDSMSLLKEYMF